MRGRGLLDDRRYALAFARELINKGPCGARLIRRKLGGRGVAPEMVEEVLAGLELDEAELAEEAVRLKLASLAGEEDETAARRLLAHLERRGFAGETARNAVIHALKRRPKESG
ncbi:MAG TPA: hypothetical protein ENN88_01315 [Candidatus Coatesbacteria bacterium]|nr:hypothetical protein [Candidatus Coatesbacteria bacterium]